jgi:DNA-binding transcriptional LysR family regulator
MALPRHRAAPLRFDVEELETFLVVADLGSFSEAAQYLHVGQPAVSSRVQRLEHSLGVRLLTRSTRRVSLTPEGELVVQQATIALAGLRELVQKLATPGGKLRHRIQVAATPVLASLVLPPLIRDYSNRFTDVDIHIVDESYRGVVRSLDGADVDVALVPYFGGETFRTTRLGQDEIVLSIPKVHPLYGTDRLQPQTLARTNLILIEQFRPVFNQIVAWCERADAEPPRATVVSNMTTLLGMLDVSMGVGLVPRALCAGRRADSAAVLDGLTLWRAYALGYPRKAQVGTAVADFCAYLERELKRRWGGETQDPIGLADVPTWRAVQDISSGDQE